MKFKLVPIFLLLLLLGNCEKPITPAPISEIDAQTKLSIEKEVRAFWAERRPENKVNGVTYQRISDSIVLVGVTFENEKMNAVNAVARKFENGSQSSWKIEPFNENWKRILRLEPENQ